MAYEKTQWANGDVISAEKLNNIEQGIEDASGGGNTFLVTFGYVGYTNTWTCDKTNAEIYEAYSDGKDIRYNINGDDTFALNTSGRILADSSFSESFCRTDRFYFGNNTTNQFCNIAMYNNEIEIEYYPDQNIGYIFIDRTSNGNGGYIVKESLNDGIIVAAEQQNNDKWLYFLQFPLEIWNTSSSYQIYMPIARFGDNVYYKGSDSIGLSDEAGLYKEAVYRLFYSDVNERYEVEKVTEPTT